MIDVVIATYNGEKYLKEQLDSILGQTYKDIHIICRDDGSTDRTVDIIREYEAEYPEIVSLITDDVKCGSSCSNFMQALKHTTAEYVMFSDQDDYWLKDKIRHTLDRMKTIESRVGCNKPVLVFGSYQPVDEKLNPLKDNIKSRQEAAYKLDFTNLLVQNYVHGCLMMVNRTLADMMGDYNKHILMHDWWGALIAAGGGAVEHIDEVMMLYRQHGDNVVGSVNVKSFQYRMRKVLDPETKKASKLYMEQARLLYKRNKNDLTDEHRRELKAFIKLFQKPKFVRVIELVRGNYLKSDLVRVLGQIWYI